MDHTAVTISKRLFSFQKRIRQKTRHLSSKHSLTSCGMFWWFYSASICRETFKRFYRKSCHMTSMTLSRLAYGNITLEIRTGATILVSVVVLSVYVRRNGDRPRFSFWRAAREPRKRRAFAATRKGRPPGTEAAHGRISFAASPGQCRRLDRLGRTESVPTRRARRRRLPRIRRTL